MRTALPRFDERLTIADKLHVSPFCVGRVDNPDTVLAAYDAGVNFFFVTADMHWPLYDGVRRGLERLLDRGGGIRDRIVVAGVCYVTQPDFCVAPFVELVEAVRGLDRLDVAIAGGVYGYELERRLPVYLRHRDRAHCGARAIGATFHDRVAAAEHTCAGTFDIALVRYNSLHVGARDDLFPRVRDRRVPLYNFTTGLGYVGAARCAELGLDPEMWQPTYFDHFRFALSCPELDGILCSLDQPAEVGELADALAEGPLDDDEQAHLVRLTRLGFRLSELVR